MCLDFQVGESSGPSSSSPSLIIPGVIISLNSRWLEGEKDPHLSPARELPGKQPCRGRREADCWARGGSCPLRRLQTRGAKGVQLNSSSPSSTSPGAAPRAPIPAADGGPCVG